MARLLAMFLLLGVVLLEQIQGQSIVEVAESSGNFNTLITALKATDLFATLDTDGPFTVFAPTDEAFAKLPPGMVEGLLAMPDNLKMILLHHVAAGAVTSDMLTDNMLVEALSGEMLLLNVKDGTVMINKQTIVTKADIEASNGVIHQIDSLIMPLMMKNNESEPEPEPESMNKEHGEDYEPEPEPESMNKEHGEDCEPEPEPESMNKEHGEDYEPEPEPESMNKEHGEDYEPEPEPESMSKEHGEDYEPEPEPEITIVEHGQESEPEPEAKDMLGASDEDSYDHETGSKDMDHHDDSEEYGSGESYEDDYEMDYYPNVLTVLEDHEMLPLLKLIDVAGLTEVLRGKGPFLFFAPTGEAFRSHYSPEERMALLEDPVGLSETLKYHLVQSDNLYASFKNDERISTMAGDDKYLRINHYGDIMTVNGKTVESIEEVENGIVYLMGGVLTPPMKTIAQIIADDDELTVLSGAIDVLGLSDVLNSDGSFTVLAPTDEAFSFFNNQTSGLLSDPLLDMDILTNLVTSHVLSTVVYDQALHSGGDYLSLQGSPVFMSKTEGLSTNSSTIPTFIIGSSITGTNGVVNKINNVLSDHNFD